MSTTTLTRRELAGLSAPEAEAGFLYAALVARDAAVPELAADVFSVHRHRLVYQAIQHLAAAGRAVELVTVAEHLTTRDQLEAVGGYAGLSALTLPEAWAGSADACADVLREKAGRRALAEAGERLARAASTPGGDPEAALATLAALREEREAAPEPETGAAWPELRAEALYGLAGDIVRMLEPETEADPVALLIHVLVGVGSLVARGPHARVGGASHHTNENAICVGKTSSARKGTAKSDTFKLLGLVDPVWAENRVVAGLSSGEGLIWAVRDQIEKQEPIRDKRKVITGYQTVITDHGVADKRLLVIEPEFASVLRVAGREGNTLSTVYRQAWDSGLLRVLNKNSPVNATGAHISIIGHITREELLMELSNNDKVNGFGNRNLWLCVQRSKFLPDGGDWDHLDLGPLISRLKNVVEFARGVGEMRRNAEARAMWHEVYPQLSGERGGLFGALTSRAEAHVLRLSCIYALLDHSTEIQRCHIEAALAVWKYCEDSAEFIFGTALGNQVADQILKALRNAPEGLTRNRIRDLFSRHRSSEEIGTALRILGERALVEFEKENTAGRPVERWFATSDEARKARKERKGEGK